MTVPVIATEGVDTTGNTNADLTVAVPSGTTNGDLLVAVISASAPLTAVSINTPGGWTLINHSNGSGTGSEVGLAVFRRIASSEPADYLFTATPNAIGNGMTGKMLRITGHDPTTPVNIAGETDNSLVAPSVTTTVNDCLVLCCVAAVDDAVNTFTPPGTLTEQWDFGTVGGPGTFGNSMAGATKTQAAAGATGTQTFTATGGPAANTVQTIAIAPAAVVAARDSDRRLTMGVG